MILIDTYKTQKILTASPVIGGVSRVFWSDIIEVGPLPSARDIESASLYTYSLISYRTEFRYRRDANKFEKFLYDKEYFGEFYLNPFTDDIILDRDFSFTFSDTNYVDIQLIYPIVDAAYEYKILGRESGISVEAGEKFYNGYGILICFFHSISNSYVIGHVTAATTSGEFNVLTIRLLHNSKFFSTGTSYTWKPQEILASFLVYGRFNSCSNRFLPEHEINIFSFSFEEVDNYPILLDTGSPGALYIEDTDTQGWEEDPLVYPSVTHETVTVSDEKLASETSDEELEEIYAIIGDFGSNDSNELAVSNLVKTWNPKHIITVGDNSYNNDYEGDVAKYYYEYISPYNGSYGETNGANRFWPALGNHDLDYTVTPYKNFFTLLNNERYYDVVLGSVHLFVINSGKNSAGDILEPDGITENSNQGQWLYQRLSSSNSKWKIVVLHHSPYTSGAVHPNATWVQWPFKDWGADIVVSGHAHHYERLVVAGMPYLVNGAGGKDLHGFGSVQSGSQVRYSGFGAIKVTAKDTELKFEFITIGATIVDEFILEKDRIIELIPETLAEFRQAGHPDLYHDPCINLLSPVFLAIEPDTSRVESHLANTYLVDSNQEITYVTDGNGQIIVFDYGYERPIPLWVAERSENLAIVGFVSELSSQFLAIVKDISQVGGYSTTVIPVDIAQNKDLSYVEYNACANIQAVDLAEFPDLSRITAEDIEVDTTIRAEFPDLSEVYQPSVVFIVSDVPSFLLAQDDIYLIAEYRENILTCQNMDVSFLALNSDLGNISTSTLLPDYIAPAN